MNFNLYWIASRKRLIISVIFDSALFTILYFSLFLGRFGVLPPFSPQLTILLLFWLLSSYVFGRYVSSDIGYTVPFGIRFFKQILITTFVSCLIISIILIYFWLFDKQPVQALFRSFLIPFLSLTVLVSTLFQLILAQILISKEVNRKESWFYLGTEESYNELKSCLRLSRISTNLNFVGPKQLQQINHQVTRLVVNDLNYQPEYILKELIYFQQCGIPILNRINWCERILQRLPLQLLSNADLFENSLLNHRVPFQKRLKRGGDILVSALLLCLTLPLIAFAALLVFLQDGQHVFYSQIRTGILGRPYRIWKLRTMSVDAEAQGIRWSGKSDSRVTPIGEFLRRTRIDELPQLWCVLIGEMSLIGPRPERPEIDNLLIQKIPFYNFRYSIKPGLSGWAQVNYPYGASVNDSSNKLSYDLFYIKNFSFWLDFLILFKTIRLVFRGQGAIPIESQYEPPEIC